MKLFLLGISDRTKGMGEEIHSDQPEMFGESFQFIIYLSVVVLAMALVMALVLAFALALLWQTFANHA